MKLPLLLSFPLLTSALFFPDQFLTERKELGGNPVRITRSEKSMNNEAKKETCGESVFCDELVAKGFCESSEPLAMKKKYCGKSCGLCGDAPTTTKTPDAASTENCGESVFCDELVAKGFCESSEPLAMKKKYCGKSCGLCGDVPTTKPTTTTTAAAAPTENCGESVFCPELVKKGFCDSSEPLFMKKKYCGKSCGLCGDAKPSTTSAPASSNCQDMSDRCPYFKKKGLCESNNTFSFKKGLCGKTCGLCGKAASPCVDSPQCASELAAGGCSAMNPMKAEYLCAATCGYCLNPN